MDENTNQQPAQPAAQDGQPGGGGRRRRRRRRKGKGGGGAQANGNPGNQSQPQSQSQPQHQKPAATFHRQNRGQSQQQGGAGRRRRRGRGATPFVGPMDHSYRDGNVADAPHYQQNRGGYRPVNGNLLPGSYAVPEIEPVGTVRHDAPAGVFLFIDDLFFLAKINEVTKKLGIKVEFVKAVEPVLEAAEAENEADRPSLAVVDLNNERIKPLAVVQKLRTKLKKTISIVGFVQQVQGDLKLKAVEAGCDVVMPRSAFSQAIPQLLRRYGAPDLEQFVD
jgi:CheY-like chemotaxis protein